MTRQKRWLLKHPDYNREYKRKHREWIIAQRDYKSEWLRNKQAVLKLRAKRRALILEAKNKSCKDCGIQYPSFVMHFDHRNPKEKFKGLAHMGTYSEARIKTEIEKCDVVCKLSRITNLGRYTERINSSFWER